MNRRFYTVEIPDLGEIVTLSSSESRHLSVVLRARAADLIHLLNGRGEIATASIIEVNKTKKSPVITCRVVSKTLAPPLMPRICLYLSPPRARLMDQIIRQAVELGVAEISPVITERSVAKPDGGSMPHWQIEVQEAGKQSGNPWFPKLHPPRTFQEALITSPLSGFMGWISHDDEARISKRETDCPVSVHMYKHLKSNLEHDDDGISSPPRDGHLVSPINLDFTRSPDLRLETDKNACMSMALWIGPEGGFAEGEIESLAQRGIRPLSTGPWTQRVETAVVSCLTAIRLMS